MDPYGLQVKKLSSNATFPTRGSLYAAGLDLSSAEAGTIEARGKAIIKTDLAISLPPGTYGRVAPRSGLAAKFSIDVGAGVIDADYRGNVGVILFNHSDSAFHYSVGDRIAQLVVEKISMPVAFEVQELEDTQRGQGGFGSTGMGVSPMGVSPP